MPEDKNMKDAIDSYVESLEKEQKNDRLVENNSKKKKENNLEVTGLEKIRKILKKVMELICLGEEIKINTDSEEWKLSVYGKDLGIAIGRDGRNMQALEYIINLIGRRKKLIERNVNIDIKDYRKKKIEKIKKIAIAMARKAISEGRKIALRPMSSYERKIIHNTLADVKDVSTRSSYEEPNRRIIIYPVKGSK
jgi:spoIIIJ-associated protein